MVERLDSSFTWERPEHLRDVCGDAPLSITQPTSEEQEYVRAYQQVPHGYLVVVQVVVVHADIKTASATGRFGLLGDAPSEAT
jgi:hypothetical protein